MPRHCALLRAINVGGHTVRMAELRRLFEELGFDNVETFIASGNVIFDSRVTNAVKLAQQIERHLRSVLGYEVATFLRTLPELELVIRHRPFPAAELAADGASLYVMFLASPLGRTRRPQVEALATPQDAFQVRGREIYWLARNKLTGTLVDGAELAKAIGSPMTMRNMTTVRRIAEHYGGASATGSRPARRSRAPRYSGS